ncbi:MAG TPA: hypothetical protein VN887_01230 [Candidatus Angelobacter sp.]|nr:hypothetical protein [Candidatus Angelobacter sp.]
MSSGEQNSPGLPRVLSVLDLLTEEELVELNHRIVQRLRLMQEIRAHGNMMNFRIGQRVRFINPAGEVIRGVLTRHNRKSVTVVTDTGHQWRVSPSMLEADEHGAPK